MITESQLEKMISELESFNVEKTTSITDTAKFCQAICAFCNDYPKSGKPGYLLIGVRDNGTLSGLRITDKLNKEISGLRTDGKILPLPNMSVGNFRFADGDVLVVEVLPSLEPPVKYDGRTWIRNGARKGVATYEEEQRLVERRSACYKSFDIRPCLEASIEDLDERLLKEYLTKAVNPEVLAADPRSIEDKLSSLRLFDKRAGRPTNAAVILFGLSPKRFFPGAYIQYVQFAGKDNAAEILDEKAFDRNLVESLKALDNFIGTAIIKRRPVKVSSLKEDIEQNYPVWAIRELVMNAVMHRNYDSNTPVKFYQYSDRIDITNPGGLYGNATPSNFPNVNDYRNPIIAEALKVYGYVNKFNRGIAKVQAELSANGNGLAVFSLDKETVFEVKVAAAIYGLRITDEINVVNENINEVKPVVIRENVDSALFSAYISELSSKSLLILGMCANQVLTKKEIFSRLGLTVQTNNVRNNLTPLLDRGLVAMVMAKPSSRNQKYTATNAGKAFLQYLADR
ncbi:MAG: RNA-binding domain-containing protein [Candidatus Cryptobacteroides sp.]